MDLESKIDKLIDDVAEIKTAIAVMSNKDETVEKRINSHAGKLAAIDDVIIAYKLEKARLTGIVIATTSIFTFIGVIVMKLIDHFTK